VNFFFFTFVQKDVVIYATPGPVVTRSAEHRVTADQIGDTDVVLSNPKSGLWSIGVYGACPACLFGIKMSPKVSVTLYSEVNDPIVDLVPNLETAAVLVPEKRMGLFRFTLAAAGTVYFTLKPNAESVTDALKTYLRKDGFPDLNDLNDPAKTAQVSLSLDTSGLSGNVQLDAGNWVLGVFAERVSANKIPFLGGGIFAAFSLGYAVGAKPTFPDTRKVTTCPTAPATPETGMWDKCRVIDDCTKCIETEGCGYCRIRVAESKWEYSACQTLDASGKCLREFELYADARVTDKSKCSQCQPLACDSCIKNPQCSWCRIKVPNLLGSSFSLNNFTLFGCEDGITCKASFAGFGVKPLTDAAQCSAKAADIDLKGLEKTLTNFTDIISKGLGGLTGGGTGGTGNPGFGPATGGAPPVTNDGKAVLPDNCKDLTTKCAEQCKDKGGVKQCTCSQSAQSNAQIVCKSDPPAIGTDTATSATSSFAIPMVAAVLAAMLASF
jgi:hypothetical protein